MEHDWFFGVVTEKDFAARQKISRAAAVEEFGLGVADDGPPTAVGFAREGKEIGNRCCEHVDGTFLIIVIEGGNAERICAAAYVLECKAAVRFSPRFAKISQVGVKERHPSVFDSLTAETLNNETGNGNRENGPCGQNN